MKSDGIETFEVVPRYQAVFRALGLTGEGVFDDPRIVVWRSVTERENCTLDVDGPDGRPVRLHVKRYRPVRRGGVTPAAEEARGIRALEGAQIPTVPLVAVGELSDGRSFVISEDLAGFGAGDRGIARGTISFEALLGRSAELAAHLHNHGLHHRDLYLCHFFVRPDGAGGVEEVRLIDAARVRRLPKLLTRRRWIVKDLAQFWYSTLALGVTDEQRTRWLEHYASRRQGPWRKGLVGSIGRKSRAIARHDARLRVAQPTRNVSLG